jgi:hypothetical protein
MKYAIALLVVSILVLSFTGCGGGAESGSTESLSLLVESTTAMMDVSGYRMSGTIEMDSGEAAAGGQAIIMDVQAEVQNTGGEIRQHMFVTIGDYKVEAYIIGDVYYQNLPGQGWMKMSTGAYMSQNMNLGMVDVQQMEMMAGLAKDAEVVEESGDTVTLSFHLDQEYMQASLDLYRKYMEEGNEQFPEEWLRMAEEADFVADMTVRINKADDLIQRMEMSYAISGMPQVGNIESSMKMDLYDYGEDIVVELPPEAAQAQEIEFNQ